MKSNQDIALMLVDYRLQDQYTDTFVIQEIRKIVNKPKLPAIIISGDTELKRMQAIEQEGLKCYINPSNPLSYARL